MSDSEKPPFADSVPYEARLEAVLESISDAFYALDADWRFVVFNKAAEAYFGIPADTILGQALWDVFPQGRGTPFEWACEAAMYESSTSKFETPSALRPDRYLELRIAPMRGGGIALSFTDITERRDAQEAVKAALQHSEEVLESISDAFYAVDQQWRFTYVNRVAEAWWGLRRERLLGESIWAVFPKAVGSPSHAAHMDAATTRTVTRLETLSPVLNRWVDVSIYPSGQGLSVFFRDISDRKDAEERQLLMVNELNHRVKNTLATVQAIAGQTLAGAPAELRECFLARLLALGRANDLLLEKDWRGATLGAITDLVVKPHGGEADGRFVISGPDLELPPKAATSVALALHELATNAAKYGALSAPDGRVELSWETGDDFVLRWREIGGPPAVTPGRSGFGTRLIERGLTSELKARVTMDYRPEGLVCEVRAPIAAVGGAPPKP